MNVRFTLGIVISGVAAVSIADTSPYSVTAYVVSAGTSVPAANSCFWLQATIAEPIAGFSSGGPYSLTNGLSGVGQVGADIISRNGFEDCSQ